MTREQNEARARMRALEDCLREFINDVRAVDIKDVEQDWPDLVMTFRKAVRLIEGKPL